MVEGKFGFNRGVAVTFSTSVLELFNEVFVLNLSKLTTFISVKVDVVDPESSVTKGWNTR
jgi:hypothetical protein